MIDCRRGEQSRPVLQVSHHRGDEGPRRRQHQHRRHQRREGEEGVAQ